MIFVQKSIFLVVYFEKRSPRIIGWENEVFWKIQEDVGNFGGAWNFHGVVKNVAVFTRIFLHEICRQGLTREVRVMHTRKRE